MTFKEKFKAERARQGAGKTFTWNGKLYTTDMASDKKQTKPKAKPKAKTMQSSPVPKRSPRETPPKVDSTPPKTLTSPKATPPVTTKDVTTTSLDKSKGGRGSGAAEVKQRKTDSFVNTMKTAVDRSTTKPKNNKPQTAAEKAYEEATKRSDRAARNVAEFNANSKYPETTNPLILGARRVRNLFSGNGGLSDRKKR